MACCAGAVVTNDVMAINTKTNFMVAAPLSYNPVKMSEIRAGFVMRLGWSREALQHQNDRSCWRAGEKPIESPFLLRKKVSGLFCTCLGWR
jgi:hypothetical protein